MHVIHATEDAAVTVSFAVPGQPRVAIDSCFVLGLEAPTDEQQLHSATSRENAIDGDNVNCCVE